MTEAKTGSEHESEKRSSEMTTKSRSPPRPPRNDLSLSVCGHETTPIAKDANGDGDDDDAKKVWARDGTRAKCRRRIRRDDDRTRDY